ncbi:MAG: two-component system, NtrC family, sensor histidine kinase PilS [Pyrinomonadaceae bacterium]|nr:two-component system, NtrC family, sensor histidine kinase PilS [Pyrinomonadaceae bacterium]
MEIPEERTARKTSLGRKLWWLIFGRLAVAIALVLARIIWISGRSDAAWTEILPALLIVFGLTLVYSLAHRISRTLPFQARLQFAVDILLVTWLNWTTDVIHSPYIALYIVIIAASSLFLGPRDSIITSVGCTVAFTASGLAVLAGYGTHSARTVLEVGTSQTAQTIGLFDLAFLVVGLLSARLAERQSRSDVRLIAATQSLASLRALHERIVESIRSGLVTTDLEGHIYTFNAAAEEITGYKQMDVRGQDASIFFGEIKEIIASSLDIHSTQASPRFEADCLTADGLRLRLGFTISPLFSEAGDTTGTVITFQDLTQIRALEETSRRQDRLAAIGRMAASIAHEIRNPLAAMRGSIQMLRADMAGDSSQTELMEIILRESDRLNRIISDFLSYARPRSIIQTSVNVGELLQQTFMLLRHSAEISPGHSIEEQVPANPALVNADSEQLQQVFWNLSRNALQAMPAGGTLRATVHENSNERMRITFSDTGRGMAPEQVEHLFEPFSSTTGGTGLGLSIVYQIIRDHGGTINVRSREGHGTTITIELPASESA